MSRLVGRHGHGVEVVVHPQRIPRGVVGVCGELPHHRPLFFGGDVHQIESPTLRNEQSEVHGPDSMPLPVDEICTMVVAGNVHYPYAEVDA